MAVPPTLDTLPTAVDSHISSFLNAKDGVKLRGSCSALQQKVGGVPHLQSIRREVEELRYLVNLEHTYDEYELYSSTEESESDD